jgi:hypothetical protein
MPGNATADPSSAGDAGVQARIAALRASGAERVDPLRFRYIEALARRAATHQGLLRRSLDSKLARALTAVGATCEAANDTPAAQEPVRTSLDRGPLGQLLGEMDGLAAVPTLGDSAGLQPMPVIATALPELKTLRRFRDTWTRLSVDRQLTRSLDKIPENPGPLNSHLLVLRALRRMQEISPAYLDHFVAHADALLWLDRARAGPAVSPGKVGRQDGPQKRRPGAGRYG